MHDLKTEIVHQISHADRHDDRLIGRDAAQGAPVEMIEVRVRDEDEIDLGQMMNLETGLLQALDHLQPLRPIRIDQDVDLMRLNQKRSVPDPGDADLAFSNFRKFRRRVIARALDEKRRNENAGEKIAFVPVGRGRSFTRVERLFWAPFSDAWRTTFLRLFFEKGIGTFAERYKLVRVKQKVSCRRDRKIMNENPSLAR